jgi:YD repeat-containing protein
MYLTRSFFIYLSVISLSFASSNLKSVGAGGGMSLPPTNNTQVMTYQPETGAFTKEIPIINAYLDDGLNFKYSIYFTNNGQVTVPDIMSQGFGTSYKNGMYGFVRDVSGQVNIVGSSNYKGGSVISNTHFTGTIAASGPYSLYSSDGVSYSGNTYDRSNSLIQSTHKKSSVTFEYKNAEDLIIHSSYKLCPTGITKLYLSKITLSDGYTLDLNASYQNIQIHRSTCRKVFYSNFTDNKGRSWRQTYRGGTFYGITYPDGRKIDNYSSRENYISDTNKLKYTYTYGGNTGNFSHVNYSGANLTQSLNESFSASANNINTTITHMDGSVDKYLGYPQHFIYSANPGNGSYKQHKKTDKSGNVLYDEVNTWGYTSNKIPYLTSQTITQDGASVSKSFSLFDSSLFPKIIKEISSDGKTRTTTTIYLNIPASSTHGHIVVPTSIITTDDKDNVINSTVNTYDGEGYLKSSTVNGVVTTYSYDTNGNIASSTDAIGNTTLYQSYMHGKPTIVTNPKGGKTTYTYDYRSLVLSKKDPKGNTTSYTYDVDARPTSITPPIGHPTTFVYSNNGLTTTKTQGAVTTTTNYDGLGRELNSQTKSSDSSASIGKMNKYDTTGNKVYMSYPCLSSGACGVGAIYTYDILSRPTQIIEDTNSF